MSDLYFQRENYGQIVHDIKALIPSHHQELALYQDSIPLDPDYLFFKRADDAGLCVIISARTRNEDILRGYAIYFIKNHHHYSMHKWGTSDLFWLHPDERNVGNGRALFEEVERALRQMGVTVMHTTLKTSHPAAKYLLESMGHTLVEFGLSKRL